MIWLVVERKAIRVRKAVKKEVKRNDDSKTNRPRRVKVAET